MTWIACSGCQAIPCVCSRVSCNCRCPGFTLNPFFTSGLSDADVERIARKLAEILKETSER